MSAFSQTSDPLSIAQLVALLDSVTVSTALSSGVASTVASELVDSYGEVVWELHLTKTDGTRYSREIRASHDGTTLADATTPSWCSRGRGAIPATWTIAVDLSGAGNAQVMRLRVTAPAANWTASVTRLYHKAA